MPWLFTMVFSICNLMEYFFNYYTKYPGTIPEIMDTVFHIKREVLFCVLWVFGWPIHGSLTRYVKLRVAHAPGMPGTFSPPPQVRDPDTHVPWCMPGSLTCVLLWSRWQENRSRHSRRMRNPQVCVSGKRPMSEVLVFRTSRIGRLYHQPLVWMSWNCFISIEYARRRTDINSNAQICPDPVLCLSNLPVVSAPLAKV